MFTIKTNNFRDLEVYELSVPSAAQGIEILPSSSHIWLFDLFPGSP